MSLSFIFIKHSLSLLPNIYYLTFLKPFNFILEYSWLTVLTLGSGVQQSDSIICIYTHIYTFWGFIFVYGMRKCSNFILWHVSVRFSQDHLSKRLFFPHWIGLAKKFVWVFPRYYRKTQENFLANPIYSCLLGHRIIDREHMHLFLCCLFCSFRLKWLFLCEYFAILIIIL